MRTQFVGALLCANEVKLYEMIARGVVKRLLTCLVWAGLEPFRLGEARPWARSAPGQGHDAVWPPVWRAGGRRHYAKPGARLHASALCTALGTR